MRRALRIDECGGGDQLLEREAAGKLARGDGVASPSVPKKKGPAAAAAVAAIDAASSSGTR